MSPQDLITDIRQHWGVDLRPDLDAGSRRTIAHLREQMGHSLELLSEQLYHSESHFFLELLQNADDNEYPDSVQPCLELTIEADRLTFRNNERGFNASEVRALCGLGNSTKKQRKAVQIGEKGIGFKAVFQVTDQPEVHSNGFDFRFDRLAHGHLGLVIPEWFDSGPPQAADGTTIVLPLRDNSRWSIPPAQLKPELLLFLRRLRRLVVRHVAEGWSVELIRSGSEPEVSVTRVERTASGRREEPHRFFVHVRRVSMHDVEEKLRADVTESSVVVALPMEENGSASARSARDVFAFLPLTQAGFRFVCHADFVLVTNREDVLRGRPWNQRLRDELGLALADAVLQAQAVPALGRSALRFLSDPPSIANEFFRPVLERAVQELKTAPCVPCESGDWARPGAALRRDAKRLSLLLDGADTGQRLSKAFVDGGVDGLSAALVLLGVAVFSVDDLAGCLKDSEWAHARSAEWYARLYATLARADLSPAQLAALGKTHVVRLRDGRCVPATTPSVFRSLTRHTSYGFEEELKLLDPKVLFEVEKGASDDVRRLLAHWHIRDADASTVIDRHILPIHSRSDWKTSTVEALMGHARYVRDHLTDYLKAKRDPAEQSKAVANIANTLYLRVARESKDTTYFQRASECYAAHGIDDTWNLRDLLGEGIDEISLSPHYVRGDSAEAKSRDRTAWSAFFARLGAHKLPRVLESNGDWSPAKELRALIDSEDWGRKRRLLELLDRNWAHYSGKLGKRVSWRTEASTFITLLRGMRVKTASGTVAALHGCYLKTEDVEAVFGASVPYLTGTWTSAEFLDAVGVVTTPSVAEVLSRLDALGSEGLDDKVTKREATRLYKFLESRFEQHSQEIRAAFEAGQLVLVTRRGKSGWRSLGECCWSVPRELEPYLSVSGLDSEWRSLREFFCENLDVPEEPSGDEWFEALSSLAEDEEVDVKDAGRLALTLYRRLHESYAGAHEEGEEPDWAGRMRESNLVWTHRGEWWQNEGDVYVADDAVMSRMFTETEGVAFLDVDPARVPAIAHVVRLFGLTRLSEVVEVTPPSGADHHEEPEIERRLRRSWLALSRYLWHKHNTTYVELVEEGLLQGLRSTSASSYDPLVLEMELRAHRAKKDHAVWCDLDASGAWLYLDKSAVKDWDAIGIELCRVLGLPDTEGLAVGRFIACENAAQVEGLLQKLRIGDLPLEEQERLGLAEVQEEVEPDDDATPADEDDAEAGPTDSSGADRGGDSERGVLVEAGTTGASAAAAAEDGAAQADRERAESLHSNEAVGPSGVAASSSGEPATAQAEGGDTTQTSADEIGDTDSDGRSTGGGAKGAPQGATAQSSRAGQGPPVQPDRANREATRGKQNRSGERLRSYVAVGSEDDDAEGDDGDRAVSTAELRRIEAAAIAAVLDWERGEQRVPTDENQEAANNPGYDVTSRNRSGETLRYIEVKGVRGAWDRRGVMVTPKQFAFAAQQGSLAWLYVVENALGPNPRIYRIQDFARRVWRFGFDEGWSEVAEGTTAPSMPHPRVGMRVTLADGRRGTVATVFGEGANKGVEVDLDSGGTCRVPWQASRVTANEGTGG